MTRRIRILAHCPDMKDATAWYRVISPYGRLQESHDDIELSVTSLDVTHSDISRHDVLLLQRPCTTWAANAARIAKGMGLAVIADYDDPYASVPINNPRYFMYNTAEVQQSIREVCAEADLVTVSTLQLQADFKALNKRTALVPNALDETLVRGKPDPKALPIRRVLWRGGDSHNEDLMQFTEAIVGAANSDAPHHVWSFWGLTPHWLMPRLPYGSAQIIGWTHFQDYFRHLSSTTVKPSIVIVPLADTHFNKSKSNIALLEGAWAGGAVLAPRWPEWHAPGVTYYDDHATFQRKLEKLMKTPSAELAKMSEQTLAWAREKCSVTAVNELRSKLLDSLLRERATKWSSPAREQARTPMDDGPSDASSAGASPAAGSVSRPFNPEVVAQ